MSEHNQYPDKSGKRRFSTTTLAAILVIGIILVGGLAYIAYQRYIAPSRPSAEARGVTVAPPNPNELVDFASMGQIMSPDALDPDTGFYVVDEPLFNAIYQGLIAFNGSSITQFVPVLARSWTMEPNGTTYVFIMRNDAYFSDGDPINATTAWFNFYRSIIIGQAPGVSDYEGLIANFEGPYFLPVGARHAVQSAFHLSSLPSPNQTAAILSQVLSNFNVHNSTIEALMSYPHQSVVVLNGSAIEFNLIHPYRWWLADLASGYDFWAAIVDPSFVDAHGGVQANQPNSYLDANGAIGSGPYVISAIGTGLSSITLKANPHYWAANATDVPWLISPAKIPNVVIEYGASHTDRIEEFDTNQAQLSYVSIPSFNAIYQGYEYKDVVSFKTIFADEGLGIGGSFLRLNTQIFPTNITDFRLAIAHAINYSQIISSVYTYNGTPLAQMYVGPITPTLPYYNPDHLPVYSYNVTLAEHYLNEAGIQGGFYVMLPNGTVLGDTKGFQLHTIPLYTTAPVTPSVETEFEIISDDLSKIGISTAIDAVAPSVTRSWTTPTSSPAIRLGGWYPDWPDPIFQELAVMTSVQYWDAGNGAWLNNSALNAIMNTLPWELNGQEIEQGVARAYNITYGLAPYIWLPIPYTYWFQQPYLRGVVYNPFVGYYYNLMYYANYTTS